MAAFRSPRNQDRLLPIGFVALNQRSTIQLRSASPSGTPAFNRAESLTRDFRADKGS